MDAAAPCIFAAQSATVFLDIGHWLHCLVGSVCKACNSRTVLASHCCCKDSLNLLKFQKLLTIRAAADLAVSKPAKLFADLIINSV